MKRLLFLYWIELPQKFSVGLANQPVINFKKFTGGEGNCNLRQFASLEFFGLKVLYFFCIFNEIVYTPRPSNSHSNWPPKIRIISPAPHGSKLNLFLARCNPLDLYYIMPQILHN